VTKSAALFQAQFYIGNQKKLKGINKIFKGATRERCCYQMIGDMLYKGGAIASVYVHILSYAKTLPYKQWVFTIITYLRNEVKLSFRGLAS
jgi:hypothetical protein